MFDKYIVGWFKDTLEDVIEWGKIDEWKLYRSFVIDSVYWMSDIIFPWTLGKLNDFQIYTFMILQRVKMSNRIINKLTN